MSTPKKTTDKVTLVLYNLFIVPLSLLLPLIGCLLPKVKEALHVRKGWKRRIRYIAEHMANRDKREKRYLFHVSSAGELQQALPVIKKIKEQKPYALCGISFYSPSGYKFYKEQEYVDFICYLPFDTIGNAKYFFETLRVDVFVVVAYDTWLNHLHVAAKRGITIVMIAGILKEDSGRLKFPVKSITKLSFQYFDKIFALAERDKRQIEKLVSNHYLIHVAGEPRIDHIISMSYMAKEKLSETPLPLWWGKTIFTMGSVWEAGWEVIAPKLIDECWNSRIKLIIAPHQFHEHFMKRIEKELSEAQITFARYSELEEIEEREELQAIIIDTIGLLSALYHRSTIAYVGGAFGKGVHNVAEPACFGVPLFFGPKYKNSNEAMMLVEEQAAFSITNSVAFESVLDKLLDDRAYRAKCSNGAKTIIHRSQGATERILADL